MRWIGLVSALGGCGYSTYYPQPVTFAEDTGFVSADGLPCSTAGGEAVTLTIVSQVATPIVIAWLDPEMCTETALVTLEAGAQRDLSTTSGTTWLARDPDGTLLTGIVIPTDVDEWTATVE